MALPLAAGDHLSDFFWSSPEKSSCPASRARSGRLQAFTIRSCAPAAHPLCQRLLALEFVADPAASSPGSSFSAHLTVPASLSGSRNASQQKRRLPDAFGPMIATFSPASIDRSNFSKRFLPRLVALRQGLSPHGGRAASPSVDEERINGYCRLEASRPPPSGFSICFMSRSRPGALGLVGAESPHELLEVRDAVLWSLALSFCCCCFASVDASM